jgi:Clp amino terminal domain, pathogenicity island component
MFERFDRAATAVIKSAFAEAAMRGDDAVGTEHLLVALATATTPTAKLLEEAGAGVTDIRRVLATTHRQSTLRRDQETLLATLGIDLAEIRNRAEQSFGAEAVTRAAWRVRRPRPRRPLRSWISCSKPLPRRRCDSRLAGEPLAVIPRVKRLLERASRAARPQFASPSHLLLVLVNGNEPACEILTALDVDLTALAAAALRGIDERGATGERAS